MNGPNRTALLLASFTEYECAKDEASRALDPEDFDKVNPEVSIEWNEAKGLLGIVSP